MDNHVYTQDLKLTNGQYLVNPVPPQLWTENEQDLTTTEIAQVEKPDLPKPGKKRRKGP